MRFSLLPYALAALAPVALLAAASLVGGMWIWAALGYMTLFTFAMDLLIARAAPPADPLRELPEADLLSAVLALSHFLLLALAVHALATGLAGGTARWFALYVAASLFFGQVSNANAHELIHRPSRGLRALGRWVYISLLFGHHASAHTKVHHRHAATRRDPNTARAGEGFYRFWLRAWAGSFMDGYRAERADLARRGRGGMTPYVVYIGGGLAFAAAALAAYGWRGLLTYGALALYAQTQLLLSDYVQHYGLIRAEGADGRVAPMAAAHSWNARHWFSSHLMLNAPRHSEHHAHPARPYPQLGLPAQDEAPRLPGSLPAMATLALFPRAWRRVMDPRLAAWTQGRPQA